MSRIAISKLQLPDCPLCEDEPLYEIGDNEYGCDKCKNIYFVTSEPVLYFPKASKKDKDGNPLFPEEIL